MKYDFAALRFTEDENLRGRVYWYLIGFPAEEGEEVLAPVGPHDRLQKARVERLLSACEEDAPYDVRFIKRAAAKYGERTVDVDGVPCLEFGGVRCDGRHFTRFGVLLSAEETPDLHGLGAYADLAVFVSPKADDERVFRAVALGHGALLVGGEAAGIFDILLSLAKGEKEAERRMGALGLGEEEVCAPRKKLG